ncbi:unnamed protein product [Chondrus crispus]|uniref:Uncharacterized protein n=1 Tax=Chondrus crispus TaxID=2769 RepID=R7QT07_CHOCR|nr:unnamed protein product [Chondrus crispus]CDF40863.1 unnamed protein product [Chondrus crispus]|eukprot:XP_005711157.1 unnamed protein product [Chondrus crispus]
MGARKYLCSLLICFKQPASLRANSFRHIVSVHIVRLAGHDIVPGRVCAFLQVHADKVCHRASLHQRRVLLYTKIKTILYARVHVRLFVHVPL